VEVYSLRLPTTISYRHSANVILYSETADPANDWDALLRASASAIFWDD